MPAHSITSTVNADRPPAEVHALLDELGAHEAFTDHYVTDLQLAGPTRGVGATARVRVKGGRPRSQSSSRRRRASSSTAVAALAAGRTTGTYELAPRSVDGTRVTFRNTIDAPSAPERFVASLLLRRLQHDNDRALERLGDRLGDGSLAPATSA